MWRRYVYKFLKLPMVSLQVVGALIRLRLIQYFVSMDCSCSSPNSYMCPDYRAAETD
jgi:hypothetical protein